MASKYWIKLYHEILDDPKMGRMPDKYWRRAIELFLVAGENDAEGLLPRVQDMAYRLRITDDELTEDLKELERFGVVQKDNAGWVVTRFAERQAPVSDAERMKRYRERQRSENYYGDDDDTNSVTLPVTKRSQIRIDKIREDDIEKSLIKLFCDVTSIPMTPNGVVYEKWKGEVAEWIPMNVTASDIKTAYDLAIEKDYTVARPGGLTSFIRGEIAKKNGNKKDDYPEFGIVYDENGIAYNAKGEVVDA